MMDLPLIIGDADLFAYSRAFVLRCRRIVLNDLNRGGTALLAFTIPITERIRITSVMVPIKTKGVISNITAIEDQVVREPPDVEFKIKKSPIATTISTIKIRGR
jgi:hypothetical protein